MAVINCSWRKVLDLVVLSISPGFRWDRTQNCLWLGSQQRGEGLNLNLIQMLFLFQVF